jgi:hypothetical protein
MVTPFPETCGSADEEPEPTFPRVAVEAAIAMVE